MRRFLVILTIALTGMLAASSAAALAPHLAFAATETIQQGSTNGALLAMDTRELAIATQSGTPATPAPTPTPSPSPSPAPQAVSGSNSTLNTLMQWIMSLFAGLVGIAGIALNVSAYYSIVKMGSLVGQLSALQVAWGIFRDLGNIVILFGFIAMGIATIIDATSYNAKKMLVTLLIVAVAINFSSLAARSVIDVGNIVGIQFYKAFNNNTVPTGTISDNGISAALMGSVNLTSVYNQANATNGAALSINYPLIAFLSIILFIIIAVVFFAISFLLISRFVILVFLITVSPLAFAGYVIPKFRSKSDEWLSALINNTIVAPVVLLLLLVSTKIVTSGTFTNLLGTNGSGWAGALNSTSAAAGSNANIIVIFMIACGFYIASLIVAKQLSAFGASTMMSGVKGVGGMAGRSTLGRIGTGAGRVIRAVPFMPAQRIGQRLIDTSQSAKFGSGASIKSLKDEAKTIKTERETTKRKSTASSALKDAMRDRNRNPEDADHKIATILKTQSSAEIEELDGIKDGVEALVQNLSPQQFKNLMDSKTLSEGQKTKIRNARFAGVNAAVAKAKRTGNPDDIKEAKKQLGNMTAKEIEYADPSFLEDEFVAENLTDKQFEDLSKGEGLSPTTKRNLGAKRAAIFDPAAASYSDAKAVARITDMKKDSSALVKVPDTVLTRPAVLAALTVDQFDALREAKAGTISTRRTMGAELTRRELAGDADVVSLVRANPRVKQFFDMP